VHLGGHVRQVAVGVLRNHDQGLDARRVEFECLKGTHPEGGCAFPGGAHGQALHADALLDELPGDGELFLAIPVVDALRRQVDADRLDPDQARSLSEK
jgi:hypothetical protein